MQSNKKTKRSRLTKRNKRKTKMYGGAKKPLELSPKPSFFKTFKNRYKHYKNSFRVHKAFNDEHKIHGTTNLYKENVNNPMTFGSASRKNLNNKIRNKFLTGKKKIRLSLMEKLKSAWHAWENTRNERKTTSTNTNPSRRSSTSSTGTTSTTVSRNSGTSIRMPRRPAPVLPNNLRAAGELLGAKHILDKSRDKVREIISRSQKQISNENRLILDGIRQTTHNRTMTEEFDWESTI